MKRYSLGLDFGSLSGRAVLLDLETGAETADAVVEYAHAVMSETLPDGTPLDDAWALQHPNDYLDVLRNAIREVIRIAGITPDQIVGVGLDCTASTVLPVYEDGTPLCMTDRFVGEKHAYVKMWKHHAAQPYADKLNAVANEYDPTMLSLFGDKVSSEWLIPKIMETLDQAPAVYENAAYFVEAADWLVWQLCGTLVRDACLSGYKALWNKRRGYPSEEFFARLDPRLRHFVAEKLAGDVLPCGVMAGRVTAAGAAMTGLKEGTPVSVAGADAHSAVPACGVSDEGHMLIIMGTSACHMLVSREEKAVSGICGIVEDGMLPDMVGYEAGQSCLGDHFEWFQKVCISAELTKEADERGVPPLALLSEKAAALRVGESGLLALDFWNGNRSVLDRGDLSGMILGLTLTTKPEEIYRALIEATGFGTRVIVERFREYGIPVDKISVCGGIPHKNRFLLQVYADLLGIPLHVIPTRQAGARGSAIYGAVAAGVCTLDEAIAQWASCGDDVVYPNAENKAVYDALYDEYKTLYYYFGNGGNDVMARLKALQ